MRRRIYVAILLLAAMATSASPLAAASSNTRFMHDVSNAVARYNTDGSLDRSFNSSGIVAADALEQTFANALVLQADGKVVVGGADSDLASGSVGFGMTRFNADGSVDTSFGTGGTVRTRVGDRDAEAHALAIQPDGRLLVAGTAFGTTGNDDRFAVARFNTDGTLDGSFGSGGLVTTPVGAASAQASGLVIQPDGKVVVSGTAFFNGATDDDFGLVRYNADGSLDATFGSNGIVTTDFGPIEPGSDAPFDRANAVALQPDGKLLVVGSTGRLVTDFALARYNPDGTLDPSFGAGGRALGGVGNNAEARALEVQPDGCIVVAGSTSGTNPAFMVARYRADGSADTTFGNAGSVLIAFDGGSAGARALSIQRDGSIVVGGSGYAASSATDSDTGPVGGFAVLRLKPDGGMDTSVGISGRVLTAAGDAGGGINALALAHDGRIVAAGLASFRVQPTR